MGVETTRAQDPGRESLLALFGLSRPFLYKGAAQVKFWNADFTSQIENVGFGKSLADISL